MAQPRHPPCTIRQPLQAATLRIQAATLRTTGNLSKLRAKLNDLTRDSGSARARGSQRALESLYAALQHSHSELDALQTSCAEMMGESLSPRACAAAMRRRHSAASSNSREGMRGSPRAVSYSSSSSQARAADAKSWWRHRRLP